MQAGQKQSLIDNMLTELHCAGLEGFVLQGCALACDVLLLCTKTSGVESGDLPCVKPSATASSDLMQTAAESALLFMGLVSPI